jgi:hypothetical protein
MNGRFDSQTSGVAMLVPRMMPRPPGTVDRIEEPGAEIEGKRFMSFVGPKVV